MKLKGLKFRYLNDASNIIYIIKKVDETRILLEWYDDVNKIDYTIWYNKKTAIENLNNGIWLSIKITRKLKLDEINKKLLKIVILFI